MAETPLRTAGGRSYGTGARSFPVEMVAVARIRPEDGLSRRRDRAQHRELQRSIERFGVLTPITVRRAPDDSGDYLLIKGQGRTLACRILGLETIPAVIVDDSYAEDEKVQQFLVENVARLKMRPVERALLIHRAREAGEETANIAKRFGVTSATVRRLLAQLDTAGSKEVAALRAGEINLGLHAVIARHVEPSERLAVLEMVAKYPLKVSELEALFRALGWRKLVEFGEQYTRQRLTLLAWACASLSKIPQGPIRERLGQLALNFPLSSDPHEGSSYAMVAR